MPRPCIKMNYRRWGAKMRRKYREIFLCGVIAIIVITSLTETIWAGEANEKNKWEFTLSPYLWIAVFSGDVGLKGMNLGVNLSFIELLDNIRYFGFTELEARKGPWGLHFNGIYADVEGEIPISGLPIDVDLGWIYNLELWGYKRLSLWSFGSMPNQKSPSITLDPYVGGRYTDLKVDAGIQGGPNFSEHKDWIDPIIGIRTNFDLSERWHLTLSGDIGGFGVGSDLTWSALGLIRYRFMKWNWGEAEILGGYKALYQKFSDGHGANQFDWDTTLYGPLLGLKIRF